MEMLLPIVVGCVGDCAVRGPMAPPAWSAGEGRAKAWLRFFEFVEKLVRKKLKEIVE